MVAHALAGGPSDTPEARWFRLRPRPGARGATMVMDGSTYDVIIVGASFAGLAVASQLRARVLLIDRFPVGAHTGSACGTLLAVPERLGVQPSVLQVHRALAFHTSDRTAVFDVARTPFCTFDYGRFCRGLADALAGVDFLQATARGLEGDRVLTDDGVYRGSVLVDASGWSAVLARSLRPGFVDRGDLSFGIETEAPRRGDALCFWSDRGLVPKGVCWFFPVGEQTRVGVASYAGDGHLRPHLDIFLDRLGLPRAAIHGGFFPAGLREPTVGNLFAVGDAAGQCLPLTGEGIRPALVFGQACGRIIQRVLDGHITVPEGLAAYRAQVLRYQNAYRLLRWFQDLLVKGRPWLTNPLIGRCAREPLRSWIERDYIALADPGQLTRPLGRARGEQERVDAVAALAWR